ncbi:MAG: aminotransferase class V-fold PLP-dependent enzyme [Gaiellaceae bacterium]
MLAPSEFANTTGYLDTTTYGLPPNRTLDALREAIDAWAARGDWLTWEEDGERCRELFAELAPVTPRNIALMPAVSVAAGAVAASLPAEHGDNVVVHVEDFTSTVLAWQALETRGVEIRAVPLEELARAVDERTQLVAVSLVQSADGRMVDLDALQATGARLFVDGSQALGGIEVDASQIDYFACHAYKWLLCPRGLGFLSVREDRLGELVPWLAGWKARARPYERFYGVPEELTDDARLHDVSLPWQVAAGAHQSLSLIAEIGPARIAAHNMALARAFTSATGAPEPQSPIVRIDVDNAPTVAERLRDAGIACAVRGGFVRVAFHLYNDEDDVELASAALQGAV